MCSVTDVPGSWQGTHAHTRACLPTPPTRAADGDVRRGVVKLYAALRKEYAEQHQGGAALAARDNAAKLRSDLAAQEEALETLLQDTPARELITRLGGLPVATERATGAAEFAQARSEAAQWQQLRGTRQAAASNSSGPAGSSSPGGSNVERAGTGEHDQASEGAGNPGSMRPVPPQQLAATKGVLNYVGGKGVPMQVRARAQPQNSPGERQAQRRTSAPPGAGPRLHRQQVPLPPACCRPLYCLQSLPCRPTRHGST